MELYVSQAAKPAPDPFIKRKMEARAKNAKRSKTEEIMKMVDPAKCIKNITTPLWIIPYKEQVRL